MRISLFDKLQGKSLNINGNVGNSNLDFKLLDFSGDISSTVNNTTNVYVSTNPNGINEFRTISEALEYVSKYKATYDKESNKWIKIIIKSGYVIEHSTHIENMSYHRVIIESEDDMVMVKTDNMTVGPNPDLSYMFKAVFSAYSNSTLPIINFSMKADKSTNDLIGVIINRGSIGHIRSGKILDGFHHGIRVGQASLGTFRGVLLRNCNIGISIDDCSNVYSHNMTIENCITGISNEQMSNIDAHITNFIYGEKSRFILTSHFSSSTWIGSCTVTNWRNTTDPLISIAALSYVLASGINTATSPGIVFSNINVNQYTPNGYIIK